MLNFNSIMINTDNLKRLSEFYSKVFDKKPEMEEEGYSGFMVGSAFFNTHLFQIFLPSSIALNTSLLHPLSFYLVHL